MPFKIACKIAKMMRDKPNQWNDEILTIGNGRSTSYPIVMTMYMHDKMRLDLYRDIGDVVKRYHVDMRYPYASNGVISVPIQVTRGVTIKLSLLDTFIISRAIRKWKEWAFTAVPVLSKMIDDPPPQTLEDMQQAQAKAAQDVDW